jgi:hypothetical protein
MVNAGVVWGLVLLGYGVTIFVQSLSLKYHTEYGPGPGFFPLWVSGILIPLAVAYIVEALKKDVILVKDIIPDRKVFYRTLALVGGLLFFCLTANFLGYFLSGFILLFVMFIWDFKPLWALLWSAVFMAVLMAIFQVFLKVSLPLGIFDI